MSMACFRASVVVVNVQYDTTEGPMHSLTRIACFQGREADIGDGKITAIIHSS